MVRHVCGTCRFFQATATNAKSGWCTHPEKQNTTDVRILVRAGELYCRNDWDQALWQPVQSGDLVLQVTMTNSSPMDDRSPRVPATPPVDAARAADAALASPVIRPLSGTHPDVPPRASAEGEEPARTVSDDLDRELLRKARERYRDRRRQSRLEDAPAEPALPRSEPIVISNAVESQVFGTPPKRVLLGDGPTRPADSASEGEQESAAVSWRRPESHPPYDVDWSATDPAGSDAEDEPVWSDSPHQRQPLPASAVESSASDRPERAERTRPTRRRAETPPRVVDQRRYRDTEPAWPAYGAETPVGSLPDESPTETPPRSTPAPNLPVYEQDWEGERVDSSGVYERFAQEAAEELVAWDDVPRRRSWTHAPEAASPVPMAPAASRLWEGVPRACRTCRDFRPAESGERGWCTNKWAFRHRRMVDMDDIACETTIGAWWLPRDDVWQESYDVMAHSQPTPLLDRWLGRSRGDSEENSARTTRARRRS